MPKVSVIIPVYGVEKYIKRCARSLFEQTLDDIEYLFIDDCTPDKSIEILKRVLGKYPHREKQVLIHRMEKNSGQAIVRKWGMLNATGDYVIHCDSDDWVDVTIYEKMYNKAIEEKSDVVVCDFCRTNGEDKSSINIGTHTTNIKTFLLNCLFQRDHWSLCNKLFKRTTCYKDIHYPTGALGEDMVLCLQLLNNCNKIGYVQESLYYYYYNPTSITKTRTIDQCLKNFYSLKENTEFMTMYISNKMHLTKREKKQSIQYLRFINLLCLSKVKRKKRYKQLWRKNFVYMSLSFFINRRIHLYYKVYYLLVCLPFYPLKADVQ